MAHFLTAIDRVEYHAYKEANLPIGSGVVEAA
jgi:hypothetical protein